METARETAQRVVNRLLGEETTATPAPETEAKDERQESFSGPVREGKSGMGVKKAWKKGKSMSGHAVAGKPGKVSYRESLVRNALNNIAQRRVEEKMGTGSGMKGAKGKKNVGTVAKKPGSVGYGKK